MTKSAISVNSLFDTFFSVGESLVDPDKARENLMDVCGENPKATINNPSNPHHGEEVKVIEEFEGTTCRVALPNGEYIWVKMKEIDIK